MPARFARERERASLSQALPCNASARPRIAPLIRPGWLPAANSRPRSDKLTHCKDECLSATKAPEKVCVQNLALSARFGLSTSQQYCGYFMAILCAKQRRRITQSAWRRMAAIPLKRSAQQTDLLQPYRDSRRRRCGEVLKMLEKQSAQQRPEGVGRGLFFGEPARRRSSASGEVPTCYAISGSSASNPAPFSSTTMTTAASTSSMDAPLASITASHSNNRG